MSFQEKTRAPAKTSTATTSTAKTSSSAASAGHALAGPSLPGSHAKPVPHTPSVWSAPGPTTPSPPVPGDAPHTAQAKLLTPLAKQAKGPAGQLAPALEAAAQGHSLTEQVQRIQGPVKMSAAQALFLSSQTSGSADAARSAYKNSNANPDNSFQSPIPSIALTGITSDQHAAEELSASITGDKTPHGYSAYGGDGNSYADVLGQGKGIYSPSPKNPASDGSIAGDLVAQGADAVNDTAVITQYAAAAQTGVTLKVNGKGDGKQVQIDWAAMSKMDVSASLGGGIKYDNPTQVANNGYQAMMAEIKSQGRDPNDKGQPVSLTGHSGGGQSSFYTALKLASEGYKNVSLVGVDMAMTPHEREVLDTLGVNVTNITSHSSPLGPLPGANSQLGDALRVAMGGGQNYYDFNVQRQSLDFTPGTLHDPQNDVNVVTAVRFAQYLDAIGQHGKETPALYDQFRSDTQGKGTQFVKGEDLLKNNPNQAGQGNQCTPSGQQTPDSQLPKTKADDDLVAKMTDQRNRPGPEANSTSPGSGATPLESMISSLGDQGKPVTAAIKGVGQTINNGFDKAGNVVQSAFGGIGTVGGFLGGLANRTLDTLGSGVGAVGNALGNGLDQAGNVVQAGAAQAGNAINFAGKAANQVLDTAGNIVSTVSSTIDHQLDKAGDNAQKGLNQIPLVGNWLGSNANQVLDGLGNVFGATGALVGRGLDKAGDLVQSGAGRVAGSVNATGAATNQCLDAAGRGVSSVGGIVNHALNQTGDVTQSALTSASATAGKVMGNAANASLDGIGQAMGQTANKAGDVAGAVVGGEKMLLVRALQAEGFDTSQIKGLSDFHATDPSVVRGWQNLLTANKTDTSQVQTITVPESGPQQATATPYIGDYAPSGGESGNAQANRQTAPRSPSFSELRPQGEQMLERVHSDPKDVLAMYAD